MKFNLYIIFESAKGQRLTAEVLKKNLCIKKKPSGELAEMCAE